ncbi:hypothetical protein H8356DRAFT_1428518 [Neocallimastix lanati (nom. inval.)]|nr:hypothetical protein H8356DRAFT_1428518 [Neocallimastix sp. JGI-2020a]
MTFIHMSSGNIEGFSIGALICILLLEIFTSATSPSASPTPKFPIEFRISSLAVCIIFSLYSNSRYKLDIHTCNSNYHIPVKISCEENLGKRAGSNQGALCMLVHGLTTRIEPGSIY